MATALKDAPTSEETRMHDVAMGAIKSCNVLLDIARNRDWKNISYIVDAANLRSYDLDLTGRSPLNRVRNVFEVICKDCEYILVHHEGLFFQHNLVVRHGSRVLLEGFDYELIAAPVKFNLKICNSHTLYMAILLKSHVVGNVITTANFLGGPRPFDLIGVLKNLI